MRGRCSCTAGGADTRDDGTNPAAVEVDALIAIAPTMKPTIAHRRGAQLGQEEGGQFRHRHATGQRFAHRTHQRRRGGAQQEEAAVAATIGIDRPAQPREDGREGLRLVEDQRVIGVEETITLCFGQQHAVGHELDQGPRRRLVGEADLVTDKVAHRGPQLFRHAGGDAAGGDAARLGVADRAEHAPPEF